MAAQLKGLAGWIVAAGLVLALGIGYLAGFVYIGADSSDALGRARSLEDQLDGQSVAIASLRTARDSARAEAAILRDRYSLDSATWAAATERWRRLAVAADRQVSASRDELRATLDAREDSLFRIYEASVTARLALERDERERVTVDRDALLIRVATLEEANARADSVIAAFDVREGLHTALEAAQREEIRNRGRTQLVATIAAVGFGGAFVAQLAGWTP